MSDHCGRSKLICLFKNNTMPSFASYMEEEEEDYDFEGALASSKPSYTLPVSPPKEEHFRPVPLAPSKAAQLSGPMQVRPKGSSSVIYQHAVQQAKLGRGRGRGIQGEELLLLRLLNLCESLNCNTTRLFASALLVSSPGYVGPTVMTY